PPTRRSSALFPGAPVHLVTPPREYPDQYAGAFGPVEVLPAVTCVGSFSSAALDPAHDRVLHRSRLTVVWFQPTSLLPSGCDADPRLRQLPWERLAEDDELGQTPPRPTRPTQRPVHRPWTSTPHPA